MRSSLTSHPLSPIALSHPVAFWASFSHIPPPFTDRSPTSRRVLGILLSHPLTGRAPAPGWKGVLYIMYISDTINRAAYGHERISVARRGKVAAVLIGAQDLKRLELPEDEADLRALQARRHSNRS
ncbi:type II toxin-antitoxin system Phd/YefM family antitoxin [Paenarthrobacter ureafaciens]|nr:type II toxin-antitoxin system Phd/YefM family antitoxin [Paenarthrobacter ureafaciens]